MSMEQELQGFIAEELLSNQLEIGPGDELLADGILDSVGVMRLVAFIDERFDYQVPYKDLTIENFRTVHDLVSYLRTHLHDAGTS